MHKSAGGFKFFPYFFLQPKHVLIYIARNKTKDKGGCRLVLLWPKEMVEKEKQDRMMGNWSTMGK